MKGQFEKLKFDEFGLVILGGIIFIGILAISFSTPAEFPPKVSPTTIKLNMDPGSFDTFNVTINGKISDVNVSTSGEIADWLLPSRTDLGNLKEKVSVPITISVPSTAAGTTKKGKVVVRSHEGQADVEVTIVVSALKKLTSRSFLLGDFNVSYVVTAKTLDAKGSTFVSKSYLFEKPLSLVGVLSEDEVPIVSGARVRFIVEETNNYGPIIVTQNGREVFRQSVGPGEVVVPLNVSDIRKSNTIRITADAPGAYFWAENIYSIRDVSLDAALQGSIPKVFNFALVPEEYKKFDHVQMTYSVRGATANLPPLRISINGQDAFFGQAPISSFNQNFNRDVFGNFLQMGPQNSIVLSFDQPGIYQVGDASLTIFTRTAG